MKEEICIHEILARGLDDWVQAGEVASIAIEMGGLAGADIREFALKLIRRLLTSRLMKCGDVTANGFSEWTVSPEAAFAWIEAEWPADRTPGLGEVCWLCNTAAGDALARSRSSGQ